MGISDGILMVGIFFFSNQRRGEGFSSVFVVVVFVVFAVVIWAVVLYVIQ